MGNNFKHLQLVGNIKNLIIVKYLDIIFPEMKKRANSFFLVRCMGAKMCQCCYSKKDLTKNERILNP